MRKHIVNLAQVVLAISFLCVAGCATGYHASGLTGGYLDKRLRDDVFQIAFQGNGYTSKDKAKELVLLRASELTIANGFKYFVILQDASFNQSGGVIKMFKKPHEEVIIQCLMNMDTVRDRVYNAQDLLAKLKDKNEIK